MRARSSANLCSAVTKLQCGSEPGSDSLPLLSIRERQVVRYTPSAIHRNPVLEHITGLQRDLLRPGASMPGLQPGDLARQQLQAQGNTCQAAG